MSKTLKFTLLAALRSAVALLFMSGLLTRCASIMTPDGGPIDTLAPVIVAMNPDNFSTSFDKKKIYIEFDEFVQIKDQSKEFYTSPKMKYKPALSTRGRGIVVTIRDTLLENTTYALNFGSSIADNNEGNPLNTMRYVFSTGKTIDSMMLSGYTEDSFKSDSVGKSFIYLFIKDSVELHADYDSIMFKYEPSAIARAENNGIFLAQNLKPIDYYIYAFQDTNDNQLYEAGTDLIGFLPGSYNPSRMEDFGLWFDTIRKYIVADPQLHFKMFTDKAYSRQLLNSSTRESQHKALLYFNAEYPIIDSIRFDALTTEQVVIEPLSFTKDTIALWFDAPSESLPDTLHGTITFHKHDSLNRLLPTTEPLALAWKYYMSKEEEKEIDRLDKERKRALSAGEEWVEPKKANPFKYQFISEEKLNPELGMT
ncbi:MAG: Ig-like domain-containing protein, partial [Rikenellaceae bacterium]